MSQVEALEHDKHVITDAFDRVVKEMQADLQEVSSRRVLPSSTSNPWNQAGAQRGPGSGGADSQSSTCCSGLHGRAMGRPCLHVTGWLRLLCWANCKPPHPLPLQRRLNALRVERDTLAVQLSKAQRALQAAQAERDDCRGRLEGDRSSALTALGEFQRKQEEAVARQAAAEVELKALQEKFRCVSVKKGWSGVGWFGTFHRVCVGCK